MAYRDEEEPIPLPLPEMPAPLAEANRRASSTLPEVQTAKVGRGVPWPQKPAAFESLADCKRFWRKTVISFTQSWNGTPCWNWIGALNGDGYGLFCRKQLARDDPRSCVMAHRASYESYVGPIEDELTLDHLCLNKRCANPEHLEPVTHSVNTRRAMLIVGGITAANKAKTHCPQGHPLSGSNLIKYPNGRRGCEACVKRQHLESRRRKRPAPSPEFLEQARSRHPLASDSEVFRIAAIIQYFARLTPEQILDRLSRSVHAPAASAKQRAAASRTMEALSPEERARRVAALHTPDAKARAVASIRAYHANHKTAKGQ